MPTTATIQSSLRPQNMSAFHAALLFGAVVLIEFGLVLVVTRPPLAGDTSDILLRLLIILSAIGAAAFALAENASHFYAMFAFLLGVHGPIIAFVVFPFSPFIFPLALGDVLLTTVLVFFNGYPLSLTSILYVLWIVSSVILTAGRVGLVPYNDMTAAAAEFLSVDAGKLRWFLDLRYVLSAMLLITLIAKSIALSFRMAAPNVPDLGQEFVIKPPPRITPLAEPFILAAIVFSRVLISALNVPWLGFANLVVYLWRIGTHIWDQFWELICRADIWRRLMRAIGFFSLTYLFARIVPYIATDALQYLVTPGIALILFIRLFLFTGLVWVGMAVQWYMFDPADWRILLQGATKGQVVTLMAYFCSGLLAHICARLFGVILVGFGSPGVFSILVVSVLALAMLSMVIKLLGKLYES